MQRPPGEVWNSSQLPGTAGTTLRIADLFCPPNVEVTLTL